MPSGASKRGQFSAAYTINMSGFDFRQAHAIRKPVPTGPEDRGKGLNPLADLITRGWLRASHRALDSQRSTEMVPYHSHGEPQPLTPGEIYKFEISLEPMAYLIKAGYRLRLEIVNGDSPASEQLCGCITIGLTRSAATPFITTPHISRN
jgi:hypothetical protein